MSPAMHLKARYFRARPTHRAGYQGVVLRLPIEKTALIGMHCWNIGCPDGPPVDFDYCVGMGWPESAAEAGRIMAEVIRPAMDAARSIGMAVCHMECDWMDAQYPEIPSRRKKDIKPKYPRRYQKVLDRAYGPDYMERSPLAQMRRAAMVSPQGSEKLYFYTDTLVKDLQERGIENLVYTGFAADMCLLGAEGGARTMTALGYRCIVMRDATVGVELPHTFPERLATRYGLQIFEWSLGYGTTFADFMAAVETARSGAARGNTRPRGRVRRPARGRTR